MKFKEIKPGMVIHCPKEEDANALLKHLESIGYIWDDEFECKRGNQYAGWSYYGSDTCFGTGQDLKIIVWSRLQTWQKAGLTITEFSDLIEPDDSPTDLPTDSPMSAKEIICWFKDNRHNGRCSDVFGSNNMEYIFSSWSADTIVEAITAYESVKKAPKPVEVEWVDVVRIIKIGDMGRSVCVCERDIIGATDDDLVKQGVEIALREYIAEHEGEYFAVHQKQCRVKEGES